MPSQPLFSKPWISLLMGENHIFQYQFYTSPFPKISPAILLYIRMALFLWTLFVWVFSFSSNPEYMAIFFIYLTNLSYTILLSYLGWSVWVTWKHRDILPDHEESLLGGQSEVCTKIHYFYWCLWELATLNAFLVTTLYWAFDYSGQAISFTNWAKHIANSVVALIELSVNNIPGYRRHAPIYCVIDLVYLLFAHVWAIITSHFIYQVLDPNNSLVLAIVSPVAGMIAALFYTFLIEWMTKKRNKIAKHFSKSSNPSGNFDSLNESQIEDTEHVEHPFPEDASHFD